MRNLIKKKEILEEMEVSGMNLQLQFRIWNNLGFRNMPPFPLLLQLFGIQICQIRCLAVFKEFCYINPEIFTDDDSLPDLPFQVKPPAQKPDTSPIMISSSEQDDSSPLEPTSPVAGQSSPQPMASSSPRPFKTGLLNKTSSPKLNMPKLGERYAFYSLIILIIIL